MTWLADDAHLLTDLSYVNFPHVCFVCHVPCLVYVQHSTSQIFASKPDQLLLDPIPDSLYYYVSIVGTMQKLPPVCVVGGYLAEQGKSHSGQDTQEVWEEKLYGLPVCNFVNFYCYIHTHPYSSVWHGGGTC